MLAAKSTQSLSYFEPITRRRTLNSENIAKCAAWLVCVWGGLWFQGCATQADLQQVQNDRGVIRTEVANTNATISGLRNAVRGVQGEVQEIDHRLKQLAARESPTQNFLNRIEERLVKLERRVRDSSIPEATVQEKGLSSHGMEERPSALPFGTPQRITGATLAPFRVSVDDTPECQDLYREALRYFQKNEYNYAIREFRSFQRQCADSEMADDAQYWIGECHYVQEDFNRAILEFNDVLSYRKGDRVPAALLRQAQAFVEIGDPTDARLVLQKLVKDHPSADQAAKAYGILDTLRR